MTTSHSPKPLDLNVSTQLGICTDTFHDVMLKGLLARAHVEGDATFSFFRHGQLSVRRDSNQVLAEFAKSHDWMCLRSGEITLIVRSTGLFGYIQAIGPTENCTVNMYLWTDTEERGEAVLERALGALRPYRITDIGFCLNWRFLDGKGEINRASTDERQSDALRDEAYPIISPVSEFIEQYLTTSETVLVLQGPPGTGKTRLIRAILAAISRRLGAAAEVLYTGDAAVLDRDEVFLEFITESHSAFVIEDADHLLKPRTGGNQTLHRFLNIADGIASAHGKKIIFSTNLPSTRDIDEALVRPGRCFAHLYLAELQVSEAMELLDKLCGDTPERHAAAVALLNVAGRKSLSVAEVYAAHRNAGPQRPRSPTARFGFVRRSQRVSIGFN
jgi:hypothetical protein